jgi:glycine cleavage system H protein
LSKVQDDLRYTKTHEWVKASGNRATIGITDFAQEELHEVVYVELPEVGSSVRKGAQFAAVESVKARSEIFSPVSGKVTMVNTALVEGAAPAKPELINDGPYTTGWLVEVEVSDQNELSELLTAEQYRKSLEAKLSDTHH